jgi:hypothetical protein
MVAAAHKGQYIARVAVRIAQFCDQERQECVCSELRYCKGMTDFSEHPCECPDVQGQRRKMINAIGLSE